MLSAALYGGDSNDGTTGSQLTAKHFGDMRRASRLKATRKLQVCLHRLKWGGQVKYRWLPH